MNLKYIEFKLVEYRDIHPRLSIWIDGEVYVAAFLEDMKNHGINDYRKSIDYELDRLCR